MSWSLRLVPRVLGIASASGLSLLGSAAATAADPTKTWHIGFCHVRLDHEGSPLPTLYQTSNERATKEAGICARLAQPAGQSGRRGASVSPVRPA